MYPNLRGYFKISVLQVWRVDRTSSYFSNTHTENLPLHSAMLSLTKFELYKTTVSKNIVFQAILTRNSINGGINKTCPSKDGLPDSTLPIKRKL